MTAKKATPKQDKESAAHAKEAAPDYMAIAMQFLGQISPPAMEIKEAIAAIPGELNLLSRATMAARFVYRDNHGNFVVDETTYREAWARFEANAMEDLGEDEDPPANVMHQMESPDD